MERKTDAERLSYNDMSFLYGRDPSILAYSQRPVPSVKQNLISVYEEEETVYQGDGSSAVSDSVNLQTVKVYLRLKPFPRKLKLSLAEAEAYKITSSTTLDTKLPNQDHNFSSKVHKHSEAVSRSFVFTQTFGPETTQLELFEEIIQPRMVDFLIGHNCTVMTYGTTNSGKSYTLQGTTTSPGIIPRGLEYVFSNINCRPTPCYKPVHNTKVVALNGLERAQEIEAKNKLLTFATIDKHQYINTYKQMQKLLQEESPMRPSDTSDAHYSVWVSFAEIYNENIYDLLSNDCQKRRPLLKLGADGTDRAFIRGLRSICVNSGAEAYQVLMAGQYNLKVAATALNARSSRSHCIFTIQLLKYYGEHCPENVELSTFTFCDLAGSERLKKTMNVGDRLKEAQNINTSLLVLGRCLKSIYEGQTSTRPKNEHLGPFRESKLTRLFQRALSGKEQIALIVNVNPVPNLYVETQNVLNFSAIAKKIVIEPKKIRRKVSHSRFSQIVAQSRRSNTNWDPSQLSEVSETPEESSDATESMFINPADYEELLEENKGLKSEIDDLKASMLQKDMQIRQELTDTYTAIMNKLEAEWKNRIRDVEEQTEDNLEWRLNAVENFYKDKLSKMTSRKRQRTDSRSNDDEDDDETQDYREFEIENSKLRTKVETFKRNMKKLHQQNETLLTDKNKLGFELGLAKDELKSLRKLLASAQADLCNDDESTAYVQGLRKQLTEQQDYIKKLKEFLNEAKEEYISITSHAEKMEEQLKDREAALAETEECANDLKAMLENTNTCLEEKAKALEILEENYRREEEKWLEIVRELTEKIRQQDNETASNNPMEKATKNSLNDIVIKKEILSESHGDLCNVFPTHELPEGFVIKTDHEQISGIPSTIFADDREAYVQICKPIGEENHDDLRLRINAVENENCALRDKLAKRVLEVESLTATLGSTKEEYMKILKKQKDLENTQAQELMSRDTKKNSPATEKNASIHCQTRTNILDIEESASQADVHFSHQDVQTSFRDPDGQDKSMQTEIHENQELMENEKLLNEYKIKCMELKSHLKQKEELMEKYEREIVQLQDANEIAMKKWRDELTSSEQLAATLKSSLDDATAEVDSTKKILHETEESRKKLGIELSECRAEYEMKILCLTDDISGALAEKQGLEKALRDVEAAKKKLESEVLECIREYIEKPSNQACEIDEQKSEDKERKSVVELLNTCIERWQAEKKKLKARLIEADKRDSDKDEEIAKLEKSYKTALAADINSEKLQKEFKNNLKDLIDTKEALARTNELYAQVKSSSTKEIASLEKQISALEALRESYNDQNEKIDRLTVKVKELEAALRERDLEMESFTKNRDKMIEQYEAIHKSLQDEVEFGRKEITRLQSMCQKQSVTPRAKVIKSEEEDSKTPIPSVEPSDSDSIKTRRRGATASLHLPAPEAKKSTRKKKLYTPVDDSNVDLEDSTMPLPSPSPSTSTRSLRNRRK